MSPIGVSLRIPKLSINQSIKPTAMRKTKILINNLIPLILKQGALNVKCRLISLDVFRTLMEFLNVYNPEIPVVGCSICVRYIFDRRKTYIKEKAGINKNMQMM